MYDRKVIYRIIHSSTEFEYCVVDAGGPNYYGSAKRARLFHGDDLPIVVISKEDFDYLSD
jgi:hypothetical protein